MKWRKFLAILLVLSILCSLPITTALAADEDTEETEYELYPLPQEITYGTDNSNLPSTVNAYFGAGIDTYTVDRAEQALSHGGLTMNQVDAAENAQLIVEIYSETGNNAIFGDVNASLFTKIDAYLLVIAGSKVGVLGKDTDAAFYGLTTLQQILDQATGGVVRNLTIQDWADVASRGFIEGYYGNPWSTEDRAELMRWAGNFKLNSYFYAPKDDPKHNARWYERYTDEELEAKIKPLAEAGNASKCQFVYALHPFMSSAINQSNYSEKIEQLKAKFEQVMGAGVRQIAVLADDAGVPDKDPQLYVTLMTDLTNWVSSEEMQSKYPGLKVIIPFCPNDYMGNGSSDQFQTLKKLPDTVPLVVTGGRIWGEVSSEFTINFTNNAGRGPYMWVNWPCSDNSKRHLIMGGYTTFLHPGVNPANIQGIVLNPMQQSEPSKVAIFGNACYSWNIWTEDEAEQAWEDSFKYVDHETYEETDASNALKELSKHMINQNMDDRVTALQESEVLKDQLNAFKTKLSSGTLTTEDIEAMRAEFQLLADASETYREAGNSRIVGQIVYWLDTWDDITAAADLLLNALDAYYVDNNAGLVPDYYTQAQAKLEQAETHGFWYIDHTEYAEVGVQHIMPFLRTVRDHVATLAQLSVDPTKVIATPVTNRENPTGSLSNVLDGNESTEVVYKNPNQIFVDDYIGVTYSRAIEIHDVKFVTGTTANPKDTFTNAVLEYTEDGTTWKQVPDVAEFTGNKAILEAHNLNLTAKGIRLRATTQRDNTWFGVREIYVNDLPEEEIPDSNAPLTGTVQKTSGYAVYEGPETKLTDGNDDTYVWYSTPGNISKANDYIGLDLGSVQKIGRVRIVVGSSDGNADKWVKYHVSYSENGTDWQNLPESSAQIVDVDLEGASARYIRLVNDEQVNKWCRFSEFQVYPYVEDHTEVICTDRWTVYQGSESNLLDGDDNTFIWYDPDGSGNTTGDDSLVGDYIGLDLGEVKQVGKVRFVVGNEGSDKWTKYHLEFTADPEPDFSTSEDWTTVQSFTGADSGKDVVEVNLGGVDARYVRMVNDEQCGCWVKFSEISVAEFDPATDSAPYVFTNSTTAGVGAYGQKTEDRVTLSKALPITLEPSEYIGIALDRITHLSDITVNDNTNALTLKAGANLDEMNAYTEGGVDARYVYLVNESQNDVTFTLNELALTIDEISGITLVGVEGLEVNQAYKDSDAELTGTYTNWFDGNVNTAAGFSRYQKTNGTITFDLGQSREITSVEALVQDSQINYIRKGVIEVADSLDGEWTSVVTIDKYAGNTYDDYTAGSVGWGEASSTYPNFRSYLGTLDEPVTARYLRIRITADYNHRFINLNEIIINGGEYVPSTSNPTFVADPPEVSEEYLPEFVADGNITTGFKPNMEGRTSGSLIYKLSDKVEIDQINILQSSGAISNAEVYVRGVASTNALMSVSKAARAGEWVKLGTLTESLTSFYTYNFESIYEIKITWGNVTPLIYEIVLIPRGALAVDATQLTALVAQCGEIEQEDENKYDAVALAAYQEARKAAQDMLKAVAEGTVQSQAQVNEAYALLNSAHRALLNSVNDLATAKEQLTALKNSYQEEDYTSNSWSQFTGSDAYKNVATVLAGNNLTAIKAATQALLNEAEQTLQRRGDLTKLHELLASIEKLNASDYTSASYDALQAVVEEAEALVEDADNATDAAIDAMVQKLTAAVENLERKPAPSRPGTSKYTLRFVTNGGSTLEAITAIKGTTIKLKDYVPIREGYTFAGWYLDADLTEKVTEVTLNASTSIYAKWTKNGMPFTDVKVGTWYYDAVAFVYENGLMQGTSATRFSPDSSLTRAMLAQILYNRAGKPTVKDKSAFTDVANDAWYADAVIWAYGEGIVSGVGGGKFAPDASITREQLAAMLYRAAGSPEVQETTLTFNDASKVSSYAKSAICWAVEEGIVTGKGGNRLDPTGTATRAEVAQMLARFEQS